MSQLDATPHTAALPGPDTLREDSSLPGETVGSFRFDLFVSYATSPDYKLVQRLESFLESFHKLPTPGGRTLRSLNVCTDGSDFRRPFGEATRPVGDVILAHLKQSRELLIICSRNAAQSEFVDRELSWFLEHRGAGSIRLAVSEGSDPHSHPEEV